MSKLFQKCRFKVVYQKYKLNQNYTAMGHITFDGGNGANRIIETSLS